MQVSEQSTDEVATPQAAASQSARRAPSAKAASTPAAAKATQAATLPAQVARKRAAPKRQTPAAPAMASKEKKPKLVRDSFTIPKAEYAVLEALKQRAASHAHPIKKSELLRAGIKALAALSDTAFLSSLQAVPAIKTGRPKKAS